MSQSSPYFPAPNGGAACLGHRVTWTCDTNEYKDHFSLVLRVVMHGNFRDDSLPQYNFGKALGREVANWLNGTSPYDADIVDKLSYMLTYRTYGTTSSSTTTDDVSRIFNPRCSWSVV